MNGTSLRAASLQLIHASGARPSGQIPVRISLPSANAIGETPGSFPPQTALSSCRLAARSYVRL